MASSTSDQSDGGALLSPRTPPSRTTRMPLPRRNDADAERATPRSPAASSHESLANPLQHGFRPPEPYAMGPYHGNSVVPGAEYPPYGPTQAIGPPAIGYHHPTAAGPYGLFPPAAAPMPPRLTYPGPPQQQFYPMANPGPSAEEPNTHPGGNNNGPPGHPDQQAAYSTLRAVHQRIHGIIQATHRQGGLPTQYAQQLDYDLKQTSQELARMTVSIDQLSRQLDHETKNMERAQATAGLQAVELESLRHKLESARREIQSLEKNNEEVQNTYQDVLRSMEEQGRRDHDKIKAYQEQLNNTRHLLFTATNQNARDRANTFDLFRDDSGAGSSRAAGPSVFNTPITDATTLSHHSSNKQSPATLAITGPSRPASAFPPSTGRRYSGPRARPNFMNSGSGPNRGGYHQGGSGSVGGMVGGGMMGGAVGGAAGAGLGAAGLGGLGGGSAQYKFDDTPPSFGMQQELGSPVPSKARQALMAKASLEADAAVAVWQENFGKVFSMVQGWCSAYAREIKADDAVAIKTRAPRLWDYLVDILYPGRPESGASHAKFLLQEPSSRTYLVQRLVLQYVVNCVFTTQGWADFRPDVDAKLKNLSERLQNTEPYKTFERQSIVDQIAAGVNTILTDADFPSFRQRKESFHQQRLKTIVGPLMDGSASRSDAGYDLHNIAATALQTSANMFQSRLSFQFAWCSTCAKFAADAHVAKETAVDAVTLQMKQWRLKLVVTPGVTLRDDRGISIVPRRVLRADVLVMN